MAGRHRAPRAPRSLTGPAAAGATIAAVGVAAALSAGFAGGEDPGEARMASHRLDTSDESSSSAKSEKAAPAKAPKHAKKSPRKTAEKVGETEATAVVKAPAKTTKPAEECSTDLDGAVAPVAQVGNHVLTKYDVDSVGGRAGRSGDSDHPSGLALDFMVDPGTGDQVADYVLQNQDEFGVTYVIWQQQYNDGSGWSPMEDRGSPTANHMDHVHVSFSGEEVDVDC